MCWNRTRPPNDHINNKEITKKVALISKSRFSVSLAMQNCSFKLPYLPELTFLKQVLISFYQDPRDFWRGKSFDI